MGPLPADLDQIGPIGAGSDRGIERIERDRRIAVAADPLPHLPQLDGGGDLVTRRKPADPARPAIDPVIAAVGRTIYRPRAEVRHIAAAVALLLERRQDGADVEKRPRRSPVDEIVAKRKGADRRAGDVVSALAVLGVGDAGEQRQVGGQLLAAVNAGRKRSGGPESANTIAAIDLFVDAEKHRAEHPVGDDLVEALLRQTIDRSGARTPVGWRGGRRWRRRWWQRRRRWRWMIAEVAATLRRYGMCLRRNQHQRNRCCECGRYDKAPCEFCHRQRPHSMPVGSLPSPGGVASAKFVTEQSPAAAPQDEAKVHGGVLVF